MPTTISVVIPTYNSASVIEQCLASINDQTYVAQNVVVCDGGSSDATIDIATSCGATVVRSLASRSAQRNAGPESLREYVVFIDSDMKLTRTVLEDCVKTFTERDAALVIPEVDIGESYWARVRGFERSFYKGVWWLQGARCFRKAQFLTIGGFDVGLIGAEDWDLDERIRQFGGVREIAASIEHDEGRANLNELMKKKTHYSKSFQVFWKASRACSTVFLVAPPRVVNRAPTRSARETSDVGIGIVLDRCSGDPCVEGLAEAMG